ncbi:MAG: PLP-dependent aminotransferase family protein [Pseudomonadota bacterium]
MPDPLLLDRSRGQPLFAQICDLLRARMNDGRLPPGSSLPPTRSLAVELGCSRATVVTAYEQLAAEGYIQGRQGSGYRVAASGGVELPSLVATAKPRQTTPSRPADPLPLQPGVPDPRLFPYRQWAQTVARVARQAPEALVTLDEPFGDRHLRQAIAQHIAEWRGVTAQPEQILVTAGSGDALEICIRSLAERGQSIGLETPGFAPLRHFVVSLGLTPAWLPVDSGGAALPGPNQQPSLVVLTPTQQFPLGGPMAPDRRRAFLDWAKVSGGWIVEDDYDSEFRYAGQPIPALASGAHSQRLLFVGSFSKVFSSALRLGYLVVPEDLIDRFSATLERYGTKASVAPQRALAGFMESGAFYRHLRRVRRLYGERRRVLLEALARELPQVPPPRDHQAGMQVALELPDCPDDRALAARLATEGLRANPLSSYCAEGQALSGLLLGSTAFTEAEIEAAVARLARVLAQSG